MRYEDYKNDSIFYISSSSTTRLMINIKNWNVVNTHHVLLYWVIWFKFAYVIILFLRLSGFDSFSKMFFLKKSDIKLKEKDSSQLIWSISVYQRDGTIDRILFPVQSLRSILLSNLTSRDMLWIERCYQWRHEIMMSSHPLKKISDSFWNRFNSPVIDTS